MTLIISVVTFNVAGKKADGTELSGTVTVPEVSHEMIDGHDQYSVSGPCKTFHDHLAQSSLEMFSTNFQRSMIPHFIHSSSPVWGLH